MFTRPYKRQIANAGQPRNITHLERTAQTASSEAVTNLESRMTWLATISSTTVYVGLFGTVLGIIDAFQGLGTAGAATLARRSSGISEALINHRCRPLCGHPALIAYNSSPRASGSLPRATDDFCRELLSLLEEIPVRAPQAARASAPKRPGPNRSERQSMAFTSSSGRTQSSLAEINITPLVDVVLVLLIIFMISAPVLQSGIEVSVPKTRTVKEITEQRWC